jgi:pyrroloquinoline quinone (PQQ) biosynthesis protein C
MTHGILDAASASAGANDSVLHRELFERLDRSIDELWAQASNGEFWRHVLTHGFDRELYRITMTQIYHYTRHNSVNQAVAAFRADPDQIGLLRFVYGHADEELGHEKMVLHDLRAIGLLGPDDGIDEPPLPAVDALINYLYGIALREGPVARLGYSYWAESVYEHIAPVLLQARKSLQLTDQEMAFFVAHAEIDAKHAVEVQQAIRKSVRTAGQAEAVHRVAVTTLWLTISVLDHAFTQWKQVRVASDPAHVGE